MGYGGYSAPRRATRAAAAGYETKTEEELFKNRNMPKEMDPKGLTFRESRDSDEHPLSVPIIINLDVTGSMGSVPHALLKNGLPTIVQTIIDYGIADPQILFTAIGDHECDQAPVQVGQFESSDDLLDHWLTTTWIEGNGGGNYGESYLLAWYTAVFHTETDHWIKRGKKGHLFTIGDEPTLKDVPAKALERIFGAAQSSNMTSAELLTLARERYYVTHIHIGETGAGRSRTTVDGWKQLMGDDLIEAQSHTQVAEIIADRICTNEKPESRPPIDKAESEGKPGEVIL
jgi:hypothetical protein